MREVVLGTRVVVMLVLGAVIPGTALGGNAGYQACCASSGEACPSTLQAVGPGTRVTGAQAAGLWELSCDAGAFHDPASSAVARVPLEPGVVITPVSPKAVACFDAVCKLPPDLCVRHEGSRARVVQCSTDAIAADAAWRVPAVDDTSAVIIGGRVLKGQRGTAIQARLATAVVHRGGAPPRTVHGSTSRLPGGVVVGMGGLDFDVPAEPPDPCVPNPAMRDASNQQVDEGNEAMIASELGTALNKYRAAITINGCNAFAWAALGDALLNAEHPAEATRALAVATRLMPGHFQAWTNLGRAAERSGDVAAARSAYERALQVRPGYAPAEEALTRLR